MLAPCTVTLADPVDAKFTRSPTLSEAMSTENPAVELPTRSPTVDATKRLPITPSPTWHRTDVSDSHVVRSHAVSPTRRLPVYVVSPMFDPCTVTLADPVLRWFVGLITLNDATSTENASVKHPTSCTTLSDISKVPVAP